MASQLIPSNILKAKERNAIKYKVDCKDITNTWLELTRLFDHTSEDFKIYEGLLDKRHNIVAKIGNQKLEEEYKIGAKLDELKLPSFISFNCIFSCVDDFSKLSNLSRSVCKKDGDPITVIIMPYMDQGRIDKYKWTRQTFPLMKNLIKHVCISMLYGYTKINFIHGDLHTGNILLKKSQRLSISYEEFGNLEVMGILPVIMDFDRSKFVENSYRYLYTDLERFISLLSIETNVKFSADKLLRIIYKLKWENIPINLNISKEILKEIDNLQITFIDSEMPPMPDFLKPISGRY